MLHSAKKEKELLTATVNSMLRNAANVLYGQSRQSVAQRGTQSFGPRVCSQSEGSESARRCPRHRRRSEPGCPKMQTAARHRCHTPASNCLSRRAAWLRVYQHGCDRCLLHGRHLNVAHVVSSSTAAAVGDTAHAGGGVLAHWSVTSQNHVFFRSSCEMGTPTSALIALP